jgi:hypothetical protein
MEVLAKAIRAVADKFENIWIQRIQQYGLQARRPRIALKGG